MKLFIIAGEASGDQLGARLLADLRAVQPDIEIRGIGGEAMAVQGLQSIFPMQELSLMGLAEVLPKIPHILRRLRETEKEIRSFQPDVVLTIDIPDFSKRLARRLQDLRTAGKIKLVHYVAPTVWAWREGRTKTMAKLFDHLFCLYPFEPAYFERAGLHSTFIGHPVTAQQKGNAENLRSKLNIRADQPVICLLPGSRSGEIQKILPVFLESFALLKQRQPDLVGLVPTLPHLKSQIATITSPLPGGRVCREAAGEGALMSIQKFEFGSKVTSPSSVTPDGVPPSPSREKGIFILDSADKYDAFALAAEQGGALAASGTVSLELAQAGCAHVIAYIVNPLTYWLVRMAYKLPYVNLINILAGRVVVPEYLQGAAKPCALASAWRECVKNALHQQMDFAEQLEKLKPAAPQLAAQQILSLHRA